MKKLKLIGLGKNEENIIDALSKSGCVQISESKEIADTFTCKNENEISELTSKLNKIDNIINFVSEQVEFCKKYDFYPKNKDLNQNFFLSFDEFIHLYKKEKEILSKYEYFDSLYKKFAQLRTERLKLSNLLSQILLYKDCDVKFCDIKSTSKINISFGLIKKESKKFLDDFKKENKYFDYKILSQNLSYVILTVSHNEINDKLNKLLNEQGFVKCQFDYKCTPNEKIAELSNEISNIDRQFLELSKDLCGKIDYLQDIKLYYDYNKYALEKKLDGQNFRHTSKTFVLEGFVPDGKENEVKEALENASKFVYIEFSTPTKEDNPPTLTSNNKAVRQSEFITDMYSTPNYKEIDPNKVVFIFFMLFMGIIMADMGYGLLMTVIGFYLSSKIKVDCGKRRLWNVIAIGGIVTILFGILFNSFFGLSLLPFRILPNPVPDENGTDGLMIILLLCLGLGVVQIAVGYLLKGLNLCKQKQYLDAVCDGFIWVLFFIGFIFGAFNFLLNYLSPNSYNNLNNSIKNFFNIMKIPGIIILAFCVLFSAVTAGRNERGFGKFSKGFGSVYGLINIMSDILSYARLFGLMLSGMIIASTFNDIGASIISNGGIGYILGPIVIIIGHTFNIAMGVLGAYIHDSRLQYIEFFGKFYTGEGEKFTPIGSDMNYIYLTK